MVVYKTLVFGNDLAQTFRFISVLFINELSEFFNRNFDLSKNFSNQRAGKITIWMVRDSSCSSILMAIKNVAPFLANN